MGQVLAIDYGKARCGVAATDDLQIVASGLDAVETQNLMSFLKNYLTENKVETLVVGLPIDLRGQVSEIETEILFFIDQFNKEFAGIKVERFDERFTSKMASFYISKSGKNKKQRQSKGLIDKVSATLILQNYLDTKQR